MLPRFSLHFHLFDHRQFELFSKYLFALSLLSRVKQPAHRSPLCLLKPFESCDGLKEPLGRAESFAARFGHDGFSAQQDDVCSGLHLRKIHSQIN